jgi:1,4-alpha-glucan branching enzyme
MTAHPGKKMLFMGGEFAQFSEWAFQKGLDWMLLDYPAHRQMQNYVKSLNHFYLENPTLWEQDTDWRGFVWISHDDNRNNIIAFRRIAKDESEVIAVVNFSPIPQLEYRIGVPFAGTFEEVFSSDRQEFGGSGVINGKLKTDAIPMHEMEQSISIHIPAFGVQFFKGKPKAKRRTKAEMEAARKAADAQKAASRDVKATKKATSRAVAKPTEKAVTKQTERAVAKQSARAVAKQTEKAVTRSTEKAVTVSANAPKDGGEAEK